MRPADTHSSLRPVTQEPGPRNALLRQGGREPIKIGSCPPRPAGGWRRVAATQVRAHFPRYISTHILLRLLLCPVCVSAPLLLTLEEAFPLPCALTPASSRPLGKPVSHPRTACPGAPWPPSPPGHGGFQGPPHMVLQTWHSGQMGQEHGHCRRVVCSPSGRTESSREEMAAEEVDGFQKEQLGSLSLLEIPLLLR